MPERTLEERWRLLAASFRESDASADLRGRLGPSFPSALESVVAALWRDVASAPRDLDRERISGLMTTVLPGRLAGDEPWKESAPDVAETFLSFVADEEGLSTTWEWRSAIEEGREAFLAALADPGRQRLGGVKFAPDKRPAPKIGRNDPCFCGSGRKYKHCCLKLLG